MYHKSEVESGCCGCGCGHYDGGDHRHDHIGDSADTYHENFCPANHCLYYHAYDYLYENGSGRQK